MTKLAKDWEVFSGKPFPVPLPMPTPTPGPTPTPTPTPTPGGVLTIDPAVRIVYYPTGWSAAPAPTKSDFDLV
jgi:hypothetical protein